MLSELKSKFERKTATIGIVGLGYVGLPLAIEFAKKGFPVVGLDTDETKIKMLAKGETYIRHIPSQKIKEMLDTCKFYATADFKKIGEANAIIICVPTPLTKNREPDMSYIESTCNAIYPHMKSGQIVVLESTTYPGTCEDVMKPILMQSGLKLDEDFYIAYSPEREDPNNPDYTTSTIPKVVGCDNSEGLEVVKTLYDQIVRQTVPVSSTRVAEATKLVENIFRSVNIALVNELKILFNEMNIDIWEVINAAATKPFGYMPFYPGPGLGGHCLVGDEMVYVKNCRSSQVFSLSELFEREKSCGELFVKGDVEYIKPKALSISSIDLHSGNQSWKEISHIFRRSYNGPIVKITTNDNRSVSVTDRHPIIRFADGAMEVVEARNIKSGDLLPTHTEEIENGFVSVKELEFDKRNADVYSIEVPSTHTFAVSQGIYVHNCIPIDPFYLTWKAREYDMTTKFIELAGEINTGMPRYVVYRVAAALNDRGKALKGSKVLIVGLAYKKDVDDTRESPSLRLIELLEASGATVDYHDSYIPMIPRTREYTKLAGRKSVPLEACNRYDCVLIATAHSDVDYEYIANHSSCVVDTRNVVPRRDNVYWA